MRIFAFRYAMFYIAVNVVTEGFGLNFADAVSFIILIAPVYFSAAAFVEDNRRVPDRAERRKLALVGLLATYVISTIGVYFILSTYSFDPFSSSGREGSTLGFYFMMGISGVNPLSLFIGGIIEVARPFSSSTLVMLFIVFTILYYAVLSFSYWLFGRLSAQSIERQS